jgi:hypothetical protein
MAGGGNMAAVFAELVDRLMELSQERDVPWRCPDRVVTND